MQVMGSPKIKSSELFAKTVRITKGHSKRLDKIGKRMGVKSGVLLRYLVEMSIDLLEPSKEPWPGMVGVNMEGSDRLTIIESRLDKLEVMIQELTSSTLSHAMIAKEGGEEILEARRDDSGDAGAIISSSCRTEESVDPDELQQSVHTDQIAGQTCADDDFDWGGMSNIGGTSNHECVELAGGYFGERDDELEQDGVLSKRSASYLEDGKDGKDDGLEEFKKKFLEALRRRGMR